jgi:protein phosphatase 2C family protein 2/3
MPQLQLKDSTGKNFLISRDYNEDRVAIIFNVSKPSNFVETSENPWPNCSFYGLYDGHGGSACADFLRDNLHKYVK